MSTTNTEKVGFDFPTRASFNITRKCNLSCEYCLSSSGIADPNELSTQELFKFIDELKDAGKPTLAIGGGEPMMRRDIFEVIAHARENDVPVSVVTNGVLINSRIARRLNGLSLNAITVSIDGLKDNHEIIRGPGSFDKAVRGIRTLREYVSTAKLSMRVTITTRNQHDYPHIIQLAEDLGLDSIRLTPVLPLGRALENQHIFLSPDAYRQFLKNSRAVKNKSHIEVTLPDDEADAATFKPGEFGNHCGREVCWIAQTGNLYPCIFYGDRYLAGNIRQASFLELWDRCREMSRFTGNEQCNNCEIYKDCRGGCRCRALWQYGDINAIDPYCPLGKNKEHETTISGNNIPLHQIR